ncbi:MAG: ABC transporter substrate-binding protein [Dehalococcoidia bacterium]
MAKLWATVNLRRAKLIWAAVAILLLLPIASPGCTASDAELTHLRVVALPYTSFATFYIPQEEGYFAEQGLEVEFVKFSASPQAIPLLAQGDLDVSAGGGSASMMNAIGQNINLRIVAGRESAPSDCESVALMVRRDLYDSGELDTVAEIRGRTVAIPFTASLADFTLAKILEADGLTPDDVEITKLRPQDTVAAFENRAIAAAIMGTPHIQRIEALGYAVTLDSLNNLMPGFQYGFVIFGPNLLDDNPELGEKFMVAYLQGVRQYAQGKTESNLGILEKYIGLDEETLRQACWSRVYPDARINVEDILTFQDWAYDNGFVDEKVTAEQLIDTRFIEYANQVLGPAP